MVARTVSVEVGMQNSGMAAALARQHFPTMALAAAAGVFSGVSQNILAGLLAARWKRRSGPYQNLTAVASFD